MLRFFFLLLFSTSLLIAQEKPVVVLELFTSQGCSSCPPADDVLAEIKKTMDDKSIIPIAYHVDYWNYIGWKDPYATTAFTQKQRTYGRKFHSSSIYTPQLVIDGKEHLVGSDRENIHRKIKQHLHRKKVENSVKIISSKKHNNTIACSYNITGSIDNKQIHYLLVLDEATTAIQRGENRNRTLKNSNIVIQENIESITSKSGKYILKIPEIVNENEKLKLVILISDTNLTILTGTQINL